MKVHFLLLLSSCFVGWLGAYDIEKLELTVVVKDNKIAVTMPNNPEIKSFFFSTELSDVCTTSYTFMPSVNNTNILIYTQDLKKDLTNNDKLRILGVFEVDEEVLTKCYDLKIDEHGNGIHQTETQTTEEVVSSNDNENIDDQFEKIIFEDNFEDNTLSKWKRAAYSRHRTPDVEFAAFLNNKSNLYVKDNQLHIEATLPDEMNSFVIPECTVAYAKDKSAKCGPYYFLPGSDVPPVFSAQIHGRGMFSFKYGKIVIRAKMPIGDWLFPYLLLQPVDSDVESNYGDHIRIAYARGNQKLLNAAYTDIGGNRLYGSVVTSTTSQGFEEITQYIQLENPDAHYGDEFHDYAVIRHRDRIVFQVDGKTYGTITNKEVLKDLNKSSHFIAIGLTVGGIKNFENGYLDSKSNNEFSFASAAASLEFESLEIDKKWKQPKLVIDHVRVYGEN